MWKNAPSLTYSLCAHYMHAAAKLDTQNNVKVLCKCCFCTALLVTSNTSSSAYAHKSHIGLIHLLQVIAFSW